MSMYVRTMMFNRLLCHAIELTEQEGIEYPVFRSDSLEPCVELPVHTYQDHCVLFIREQGGSLMSGIPTNVITYSHGNASSKRISDTPITAVQDGMLGFHTHKADVLEFSRESVVDFYSPHRMPRPDVFLVTLSDDESLTVPPDRFAAVHHTLDGVIYVISCDLDTGLSFIEYGFPAASLKSLDLNNPEWTDDIPPGQTRWIYAPTIRRDPVVATIKENSSLQVLRSKGEFGGQFENYGLVGAQVEEPENGVCTRSVEQYEKTQQTLLRLYLYGRLHREMLDAGECQDVQYAGGRVILPGDWYVDEYGGYVVPMLMRDETLLDCQLSNIYAPVNQSHELTKF